MLSKFEKGFEKIKKEGNEIKKNVREKVLGYILAAFGLVAGLAWNEAIKALIEQIFPLGKNTLIAKFVYAALVTVAVVVVSAYLVWLLKKEE